MTRKGRMACLVMLLGAALFVAACGSSDGDGDGDSTGTSAGATTTSSSSSSSSEETTTAAAEATDDAWAIEYTGGTAGAADSAKAPVKIGFFNMQGGVPAYPEASDAAMAAQSFVNERLGGIDGHPLELVPCYIKSEEDGQKCGSQFVNDDDIQAVVGGLTVVGNGSLYETLGERKPVILASATTPADLSSRGVYVFNAGPAGPISGEALFIAQDLDVRTVAVVHSDNAAGKEVANNLLAPILKAAGIEVKLVPIADTANGPEIVSAIQASGAAEADVFAPIVGADAQCAPLVQAMRSLGIDTQVVSTFTCENPSVLKAIGGEPPDGWYFSSYGFNPYIPNVESGTDTYIGAMKQYGDEQYVYTGQGSLAFSAVMTMVKFANQIGPDQLTSEAVTRAIKAFRGPMMMAPGPMKCGANKQIITACGKEAGIEQFRDGRWTALRGGGTDRPLVVFDW